MLMPAAATILLAGFAATAAAQPDPPPPIMDPAPGVTPVVSAEPGGNPGTSGPRSARASSFWEEETFTTAGSSRCSSARMRARSDSSSSSSSTGTAAWAMMGPVSTPRSTKWTVQPAILTAAS